MTESAQLSQLIDKIDAEMDTLTTRICDLESLRKTALTQYHIALRKEERKEKSHENVLSHC